MLARRAVVHALSPMAGDGGAYEVVEMTAQYALELSGWRYPGELAANDRDAADAVYTLDPVNGYFAVVRDDALIGFCSFGADGRVPGGLYDEDAVDIGFGLAELIGRGLGPAALSATLAFAANRCQGRPLRATIAATNNASRRLFESAGFVWFHMFDTAQGVTFNEYVRPATS